MQREHVKAVFSRNEWEEGKTKPQENETEQVMTREISDSKKQVKGGRTHVRSSTQVCFFFLKDW
jgi:hypothetical protein